jgi:hypothetical protein
MTTDNDLQQFLNGLIPTDWFQAPVAAQYDDDEILIVGTLGADRSVDEFRGATRLDRMAIADQVEAHFGRKVSWGVAQGETTNLFTTYSPPLATRLRLSERAVLDTLVRAGVARSRSDALGWCVKLVARHEAQWLADLRGALVDVERIRDGGPTSK